MKSWLDDLTSGDPVVEARWFLASLLITVVAQFGDYFSTLYGFGQGFSEGVHLMTVTGQNTGLVLKLIFSLGLLLPLYFVAWSRGGFIIVSLAVILAVIIPVVFVGIVLRNLLLVWGYPTWAQWLP